MALLLSIIGGHDLTLYEVDEAASRVREEVDPEANIIVGATFDDTLGIGCACPLWPLGMSAENISAAQAGHHNTLRPTAGDPELAAPAPLQTGAPEPQPADDLASLSTEHVPAHAAAAAPEGGRMTEKLSKFLSKTTQAPIVQTAEPPMAAAHVADESEDWDQGGGVIIEDRAPQLTPATMHDPSIDMHAQAAHLQNLPRQVLLRLHRKRSRDNQVKCRRFHSFQLSANATFAPMQAGNTMAQLGTMQCRTRPAQRNDMCRQLSRRLQLHRASEASLND